MNAVEAPTLGFRPLGGGLALLVHGSEPPSDEDWSRYLDAIEGYGRECSQVNLLVVAESAGPSTAQRLELARRAPRGTRTAVVSASIIARGIVALIRWVEPQIRAFAPAAIAAGLDYLGVRPDDHDRVLMHVTELRAKLGCLSASAPARTFGLLDFLKRLRRRVQARRQAESDMAALIAAFEARDREFQEELKEARRFQQQLITLPAVEGVTVQSFYEPMGLIGGDLYAISQLGSTVRVFIADATGHGIRAAMTTMVIKNAYQSFSHRAHPSDVLEALNDSIASTYRSTEMMFTAACADIDIATGRVTLASAGHPAACAIKNGEIVLLEPDGAPMGVKPGMKYESATLTLAQGDGIYFCTDGIAEARCQSRHFGEQRLHERIRDAHAAGQNVAAAVREALLAHVGSYLLTDDASFLGLRVK